MESVGWEQDGMPVDNILVAGKKKKKKKRILKQKGRKELRESISGHIFLLRSDGNTNHFTTGKNQWNVY